MEIAGAMTNVISFQPRSSTPADGAAKLKTSATIVIFPGVRYERTQPDADKKPSRRGNSRAARHRAERTAK